MFIYKKNTDILDIFGPNFAKYACYAAYSKRQKKEENVLISLDVTAYIMRNFIQVFVWDDLLYIDYFLSIIKSWNRLYHT